MKTTDTIDSQAPARVDLAGGTLDIWPLYLFHDNSQTVNFAIDLYARCRITPRRDGMIELASRDLNRRERFASLEALRKAKRWKLRLPARLVMTFAETELRAPASGGSAQRRPPPLPSGRGSVEAASRLTAGFTLETESGVPAGSGLGGSSALNIAICGALAKFTGGVLSRQKMIELARNVEAQVLGVPTGEQDYYSAMFGGVQAIHLTPRGVQPERLPVSAEEINSRFVLCYSGDSRNSGINNWEVQKAHIDGRRAVIRHFSRIAAIAAEMRAALVERDRNSVARLLRQEWEARKKNHPGITTPTIERLINVARRNGAMAAKACGAGGGGCVVFHVEQGARTRVESALSDAGARVLPLRLASRGLRVW
jgi:D-glycero-alpha-D-manno-heptose-7-phosphate kinase